MAVEYLVVVEKRPGCPEPVAERKIGVVDPVAVAELVGMSAGELVAPDLAAGKEPVMVGRLVMSVVLGIWTREEPEQLVDLNGLGKCDRFRGCWV